MCVEPSLWVVLAMAGVTAAPRAGIPVHEHTCLFSFLPLWGQSWGMCVMGPVFYR
jgi:hypothetical protein